jgi:hypothetical protein
MPSLFAIATPLALVLPLLAGGGDMPGDEEAGARARSAPQCEAADAGPQQSLPARVNPLAALRQSAVARQVRIEQRVVVRIAPAATRQNLLADLPQRAPSSHFEERGKEKCVPLDGIAGVQTGSGNRLVLFLRDRRMLSLNLEKACRSRDFYSGFYVEKSKDGRLCVDRDKLQSRTGVRCEVEAIRRLVEVRD